MDGCWPAAPPPAILKKPSTPNAGRKRRNSSANPPHYRSGAAAAHGAFYASFDEIGCSSTRYLDCVGDSVLRVPGGTPDQLSQPGGGSTHMLYRRCLLALACVLLAAGVTRAQETTTGSVAGKVVDGQGLAVPGATVTITT